MTRWHSTSESAALTDSQLILASLGGAWWHWLILALVLAPPIYILGFHLSGLQLIYLICANRATDRATMRLMRAAGRFLTRGEVQERTSTGVGTILVEFPLIGSNVTRAWWTDDDVLSIASMPPPEHDEAGVEDPPGHPFDIWCHEKYTDPICGSALLFAFSRGEEYAKRLTKEFPTIKIVTVRTGWTDA